MHIDGHVVVTVPYRVSMKLAEKFVESKKEWIEGRVNFFSKKHEDEEGRGLSKRMTLAEREKDYENHKEEARRVIMGRAEELNKNYGFVYGSIGIRNQKTRFGSCSKKGNLNFNYNIALLPARLSDYVIVHELCHLSEFNHSQKFWSLVAKTIPDHLMIRDELKESGLGFH